VRPARVIGGKLVTQYDEAGHRADSTGIRNRQVPYILRPDVKKSRRG
jgi:hypothetical protein